MFNRGVVFRTLAALALCSPAVSARDENVQTDTSWRQPLASRNQVPLALLFIYLTPDNARVVPRGTTVFDLDFDYSNIILEQQNDAEVLRFDLEYLRTLYSLRRGFAGGIELRLSIPIYFYYGGFLDPFVNSFHESFGFPNVLRAQTPYGLVDLQYRAAGRPLIRIDDTVAGLGDVSLVAKKVLLSRDRYGLALRGSLKFPTGDPESLGGSGATDYGIGLAFDRIGDRLGVYGNANYHFLGATEYFPTKDFFSFMAGVDYRFKPRLAALLQADYVRPQLEGSLPLLQKASKQLALGLRFRQTERVVFEWRLVEDLSTFSPDFTFAFQMGIRWDGADR
jgi:hypothetical protein